MNFALLHRWWMLRTIGPIAFLATGVALLVIKYPIDWSIARAHGASWTPLSYLIWPGHETLALWDVPQPTRVLALQLLAVAIPFIVIGVVLTMRRLRDAGYSPALSVLFFVPLVNVPFLLGLCFVPSAPPRAGPTEAQIESRLAAVQSGRTWLWLLGAIAGSVLIGAGLSWMAVAALSGFGLGIFVAVPVLQGMSAAVIFGAPRPRIRAACVGISIGSVLASYAVLFVLALDGAVCLVMALPLVLPIGMLGGVIGFHLQRRLFHPGRGFMAFGTILLLLASALIALEAATLPAPHVRAVTTRVLVRAAPERVWPCVIEFPPLAEPDDLLFRLGIAYPLRAEIVGHGCGATRHCVFSTGAFVEPIDVWDEPNRLAFRVTDQPAPMREWSPYEIEPAHLHGFLESHRGEFRLVRQEDGGTLLEGTTWYSNRMWPSAYWNLWSDSIIHSIHSRVLEHIRALAERE